MLLLRLFRSAETRSGLLSMVLLFSLSPLVSDFGDDCCIRILGTASGTTIFRPVVVVVAARQ